jgi:hypothetical protein
MGLLSAPRRRRRLRRSAARAEASSVKGALIGCGSSLAMVWAKHMCRARRRLEPARAPAAIDVEALGTGVLPRIGERSGVTSTMPPHLRSIRMRRKIGKISQIAASVCSIRYAARRVCE